jgi:3-hydroxybutyryl-CoA dehydrogenase
VGAGVIGAGVAFDCARAGHSVVLVDVRADQLERARSRVDESARMLVLFRRQRSLDSDAIKERIALTTDLDALAEADVIVENVTEEIETKRAVYRSLDDICSPRAIFAANTSAIPIARLASFTRRAPSVIGVHFMNPVPLKTTVEVIVHAQTSEETLARVHSFLAELGKEGIVVNDAAGFVANRVLMLAINEAARVVAEGVASAEDVDRIFTACIGHKTGPLATADLIGLDTIVRTLRVLEAELRDPKFAPAPILLEMLENGRLGQKSGRGFHEYHAV